MKNRHKSTYAPFCPNISLTPNIDYSAVTCDAIKFYPGAKSETEALCFMSKHLKMSLENGIRHYSAEAHKSDADEYSRGWVQRYMDDVEALAALEEPHRAQAGEGGGE